MSETYNGWRSFESWAVGAWLTADAHTYAYWQERAAAHREASFDDPQVLAGAITPAECAQRTLADEVYSTVSDDVTDAVPANGLAADLVAGALSRVDWFEQAEHLLAE